MHEDKIALEDLFVSDELSSFIKQNSKDLPSCLTKNEKEELLLKIWNSLQYAWNKGFNFNEDDCD